jgi:hypothetical protein
MLSIRRTLSLTGTALAVGLIGGCAMQQAQVEQNLSDPGRIDCRTAYGDLRVLQSEKADLAQRVVEGATAVYPAGAVMGILTGTEGTKISVATGDYDAMIDQRMAAIRRKCGI